MGNGAFHQKKLLQNISGKEGIIGKSISMFQVAEEDDLEDTLISCCIIGQAKAPEGVKEAYAAS